MNYRHIYHAGNFADVVKHVVLTIVFQALQRKKTPFCFLDTHGGIGLYSLHSVQTQKKQEYQNGIAKLFFQNKNAMPQSIKDYLTIVANYNARHELYYYPGSPVIAADLLSQQDQIIICELHPEDVQTLKENMSTRVPAAIHHLDAYSGMKAFIPPKLKRGLVLIDPPFEVNNEFQCINDSLKVALKHWRSGHFMLWYPIKDHDAVKQFHRDIELLDAPHFFIHFKLNTPAEDNRLSACGILLINPPWQVKELLIDTILPYLADKLEAAWEII